MVDTRVWRTVVHEPVPETVVISPNTVTVSPTTQTGEIIVGGQQNLPAVKKWNKNTGRLHSARRQRLPVVKQLYYVEKLTQKEIAEKLGIGLRHIVSDIRLIKDQSEALGREAIDEASNKERFFDEMIANYHTRIRKLWELFNKTVKEDISIEVLREIRNQEKHYIMYLQDIGVQGRDVKSKDTSTINFISFKGKHKIAINKNKINIQQEETNEEDSDVSGADVVDAVSG